MVQTHKRNTDGSVASGTTVLLFVACLFGSLSIWISPVVVEKICGKCSFFGGDQSQSENEDNGGVEVSLLRMPSFDNLERPSAATAVAVATGNGMAEHSVANDHTTTTSPNEDSEKSGNRASLPWSAIESSPAPIFAIDHEMRIASWSPGACVAHGVVLRCPHTASLIHDGHLFVGTFEQGCRTLCR
jgi:hypothetical protein